MSSHSRANSSPFIFNPARPPVSRSNDSSTVNSQICECVDPNDLWNHFAVIYDTDANSKKSISGYLLNTTEEWIPLYKKEAQEMRFAKKTSLNFGSECASCSQSVQSDSARSKSHSTSRGASEYFDKMSEKLLMRWSGWSAECTGSLEEQFQRRKEDGPDMTAFKVFATEVHEDQNGMLFTYEIEDELLLRRAMMAVAAAEAEAEAAAAAEAQALLDQASTSSDASTEWREQ